VKRNLASLFKTNPQRINALFTGNHSIIKKSITYQSAMKYKMAFETAGAVCGVEESKIADGVPSPQESHLSETFSCKPPPMFTCPKCGFRQEQSEQCLRCGIVIEKYVERTHHTSEWKPRSEKPLYFPVSRSKLIVMSLCTFGIYETYWFYKNWQCIKDREVKRIRPFWRAIFSVLFCHSLFKSIQNSGTSRGLVLDISPGWLAIGYLGLSVAWRLPDPLLLVSMFTFLPLLPAQDLINRLNEKMGFNRIRNDHFSGKNIAVIILGGILFFCAIIGTFMPQ
jgi:hypothetical protein